MPRDDYQTLTIALDRKSLPRSARPKAAPKIIGGHVARAIKEGAFSGRGPFGYFGSSELHLTASYLAGLQRAVEARQAPARRFFENTARYSRIGLMCAETPVPSATCDHLAVDMGWHGSGAGDVIGMFHGGGAGAASPLHFDRDLRWVCHVNLFGRKRLWLFPPSAGRWWPSALNIALLHFGDWSEEMRAAFTQTHGGAVFELGPGDAVYFPPLWWHVAVYDAPSLSVSLRFDQRVPLRPFAALPQSPTMQRIVHRLWEADDPLESATVLNRTLGVFFKDYPSAAARHAAFRACLALVAEELGAGAGPERSFGTGESLEERVLAAGVGFLYDFNRLDVVGDKLLTAEDETTRGYLFESVESRKITPRLRLALARYATSKRQGLRPRRGMLRLT